MRRQLGGEGVSADWDQVTADNFDEAVKICDEYRNWSEHADQQLYTLAELRGVLSRLQSEQHEAE